MPEETSFFDNDFSTLFICTKNSLDASLVEHFVCKKGMRLFSRLFYVRNGKTTFYTKNKKVVATAGDIVYIPYDTEYESYWEHADNIDYISVLFKQMDSNGEIFNIFDDLCVLVKDNNHLHLESFEKIADIYNKGKKGYKLKCQSLLIELLYAIMMEQNRNTLETQDSIYQGIWYIENHYQKEIDVDKIAAMCGICPSYFRKKFHEAVGMSPIEYKNFLKTKKSIELLMSGEFGLNEIADIVGFNDVFYYSKVFKRFWGTSPKKYAEKHREKE